MTRINYINLHVSGSVRVRDGQNRARGFALPLAEGFDCCSGITANDWVYEKVCLDELLN